jgi:hypothetical protein
MESAGTLPTGLAAATTYYAIRVDANTIKLATSAANASGGTAISLTGAGSGTSTIWDSTLWQDRLHMWSAGLALVAPYIVDAVVALDDVTPPSVPASFAHGTPLGTSVPFTWSVSTGSPVAYQIRRATNSGFTTGVADTTITGGSSTSGSVTGLSGSTLYYFKIRARDIAGNWSAYSTAISATTDVAAFSPSDLTGLRQWLKADALSLADNDPVSSWTDSSGNALHATNTGSARPTFKTSIVNSLPIVRFDGADDLLVLGDHSSLTEAEVFIVVKLDTEPPASGHCGLWYMTTNGNNEFYPFTDGSVYENFGSTVRYSVGNPTPALTSWRIYGIHAHGRVRGDQLARAQRDGLGPSGRRCRRVHSLQPETDGDGTRQRRDLFADQVRDINAPINSDQNALAEGTGIYPTVVKVTAVPEKAATYWPTPCTRRTSISRARPTLRHRLNRQNGTSGRRIGRQFDAYAHSRRFVYPRKHQGRQMVGGDYRPYTPST